MIACKCGDDFPARAKCRIAIQSAVIVADDAGGWVETWADALTLWAMIEPMAGREVFLSSQLQSRVDARITVRYQSSLVDTTQAAKFRVKFGTRIYNVKAVKNLGTDMKLEGKTYQQLLCTEGEPS
jgi:SPP1 family predicted phage head-tail adaptor